MPDDLDAPQDTSTPAEKKNGLGQEGVKSVRGPADQFASPTVQSSAAPRIETLSKPKPNLVVGERGLAEVVESGAEKS
jgi:hypothetical protein